MGVFSGCFIPPHTVLGDKSGTSQAFQRNCSSGQSPLLLALVTKFRAMISNPYKSQHAFSRYEANKLSLFYFPGADSPWKPYKISHPTSTETTGAAIPDNSQTSQSTKPALSKSTWGPHYATRAGEQRAEQPHGFADAKYNLWERGKYSSHDTGFIVSLIICSTPRMKYNETSY